MNATPRFSLVIPTRNRAHLVVNAIQTALDQKWGGDYEIIVSDNDSQDGTPDAVRPFIGGKLRYYRTDRTLGMPDSWEFAISHVRGEWVHIFADDNVVSSHLLQMVDNAAEQTKTKSVTWRYFNYHSERSRYPERRNSYMVHGFTRNAKVFDSSEGLRNLYSFRPDITLPKMLNSFCHRSIIERIRGKLGRFFHPPAPDFTACCGILASIDRFAFVDAPLGLSSSVETSPHASQPNFTRFKQELREQSSSQYLPFQFEDIGPWNIIAESIAHMKALLKDDLKDIEIDIEAFVIDCYAQMATYKGWSDLPRQRAVLDGFVEEQPSEVRSRIRSRTRRQIFREAMYGKVSEAILDSPRWLKTRALLDLSEKRAGRRIISGAKNGFDSNLGAMRDLDRHFLSFARAAKAAETVAP